jgi:tRNA nucleotidyltransferase (CCA-adding enzyme)
MEIYLVGGAVRDELLGLPVKERDWVVVGGSEENMLANGFQKVGKDFPVFLHPDTKEEYALARTERKIGQGYYGFQCHSSPAVTLEEDLQRRDLTINAMAKASDGKIIDPFHGQQDLRLRLLRHVSPAFSEDPVRILRIARFAARFASLGFTVAKETQELLTTMVVAGEVDALVPERVWQELSRTLLEESPTSGIQILRDCGALARLFPALDKLWGVPQEPNYHPEIDTGEHIMLALAIACGLTADPKIRFAVLCHDLGKGVTPIEQWPNHNRHAELGVDLIKEWCKKYRVPNDYKELASHVARWHMVSHDIFNSTGADIMQMLSAMNAFRHPQIVEEFLIAAESDCKGRKGFSTAAYPQANFLRQAFVIAQQISAQTFINQGFQGEELGRQIYQARITAIDAFRHANGV